MAEARWAARQEDPGKGSSGGRWLRLRYRSGRFFSDSLPAGHGDDGDFLGAGLFEDAGALVGCGAGGEDIVHQEDGFVFDLIGGAGEAAEADGAFEVFEAGGAVEVGLVAGGAGAAEDVGDGEVGGFGKLAAEFFGLVVAPVVSPPPVEGDGDQDPTRFGGDPGVF